MLRRDGYGRVQFVPFARHSDLFAAQHLEALIDNERRLLSDVMQEQPVVYEYSLAPEHYALRARMDTRMRLLSRLFLYNQPVAIDLIQQHLPEYASSLARAEQRGYLQFPLRIVPAFDCFFVADPVTSNDDRHVFLHNDSLQMARHLRASGVCQGRTVADVGTGSGILATIALHAGARRVIAVDINPRAIEFARTSFALNCVEAIEVRLGSIANVVADADLIISNPPYMPGRTALSLGGGGQEGLDIPREFVRCAAEHGKDLIMILESPEAGDGLELGRRLGGQVTHHQVLRHLAGRALAVFEFHAARPRTR